LSVLECMRQTAFGGVLSLHDDYDGALTFSRLSSGRAPHAGELAIKAGI
jgi:hypothetical protein